MINNFVKKNRARTCVFSSMGELNYLSTLKIVDGILGNSSSGILEAPALKTPTINIGKRQSGRLTAKSVLNVPPNSKYIIKGIKKILSIKFKKNISKIKNPYGHGGASFYLKFLKNN